jgi:thioredoxin:protein disulfide reductase
MLVRVILALVALVSMPARAADDPVRARLAVEGGKAVVEATIASGWHVNGHQPRDEFLIPTTVTFTPPPTLHTGDVIYPAPVEKRLAFGDKPFLLYEGTVRFAAPLDGTPAPDSGPLKAVLRYQACDDTRCLPPRSLELSAPLGSAASGGAGRSAGPGGGERVAGWIARWGYPLTFLWVALLGVALNLTPCVYPLISVTVAFFGGRSAGDRRGAIRRALVYVLGICLSFSALGVTAALTGSLFGAALQRPPVLGGIALLMVGLALSNFGLYQFRLPSPIVQRLGRMGEGDLGALFMGLTMGVVAAPCIGPVVVALLLFVGSRQSAALGFALFFVLGLGMGAPYVGLAALADRMRGMPRAGAWLGLVEHVFGFLLLGLALYFAGPLLPAWSVRALFALLAVAAGTFLGFIGTGATPALRWPRRLAGVALIAFALVGITGKESESLIAWSPFSEQSLAQAASASRPVLIDFQADWCIPCREMDRTTFRDPGVVRIAGSFTTLKVDVTAEDEAVSKLMSRFGVAGVPTYVLLGADGRERRRLVGFVPAKEMLEAMEILLATSNGAQRG